ncbi:hypothetical protein FGB62_6g231 [Gracilaria domingensis]|nr:hypothetical protein FGB62_6g231 [Gracilaria domingensis]
MTSVSHVQPQDAPVKPLQFHPNSEPKSASDEAELVSKPPLGSSTCDYGDLTFQLQALVKNEPCVADLLHNNEVVDESGGQLGTYEISSIAEVGTWGDEVLPMQDPEFTGCFDDFDTIPSWLPSVGTDFCFSAPNAEQLLFDDNNHNLFNEF